MKTTSKPCKACPFRNTALAGWLGPWKPVDLIEQIMSEGGFSCHLTIKENGNPEGTQQCAGALISANKSCKSYRAPELNKAQQALLEHPDTNNVMDSREFLEHHENSTFKSWEIES